MRTCSKCNVEVLDDEAKFCIECGNNLNSQENNTAPIEIKNSSAIKLKKGQRADVTKNNPSLKNLIVGFGWNVDKYSGSVPFEMDSAAFLLGSNGKVLQESDFIFYNNPTHNSSSVRHVSEDIKNPIDKEQIKINIAKIPEPVSKISFTITINEPEERKQNFGQINDIFIRMIDENKNAEILRFDLEDFSVETAIVVGEFYRYGKEWKFKAIGSGFNGGLAALCKNFGIDAIN